MRCAAQAEDGAVVARAVGLQQLQARHVGVLLLHGVVRRLQQLPVGVHQPGRGRPRDHRRRLALGDLQLDRGGKALVDLDLVDVR